ncbi:hypothetical protein ACFVYD_07250 [Streptomyces sp. NPDC058301]|uniref:hypothetical protein n=1 Tax=Streptomyces sp. NPDC058301 TaxID=3346436 RepID=UPI0036E4AACA
MAEVLNSLSDGESDQVARLAVARFAPLALLSVSTWWNEAVPAGYRPAVGAAEGWATTPPSPRDVARLESLVDEALDTVDETPTGEAYYPYQAAAILSHCAWGLGGNPGGAFLVRLREEIDRYAGHVDWQLRQSRIPTLEPDWFRTREEKLWLRVARLGDEGEYAPMAQLSREIADEYTRAVTRALSDEATADYVLVVEDAVKDAYVAAAGAVPAGVRVAVGESLHLPGMDDANRTYFETPAFVYVWGGDGEYVAGLLRRAGTDRVLVDTRRQDGSVIEGRAFAAAPVPTSSPW